MATRILVFNPMLANDIRRAEDELDALLSQDYVLISTTGGAKTTIENRSVNYSTGGDPFQDYVVMTLYLKGISQPER